MADDKTSAKPAPAAAKQPAPEIPAEETLDDAPRKVYAPIGVFFVNVNGVERSYREDADRVYEGDPVLKQIPHLFVEVDAEPEQ